MNVNATLFFECVFFLSFVYLTMKYIWPHIDAVLAQRLLDIEIGIERARAAEDELNKADKHAKAIISDAQSNAELIVKQAHDNALLIKHHAEEEAAIYSKQIIDSAYTHIEQEKNDARQQLKKETASIALLMVHKALKQHNSTIDKALMTTFNNDVDEMAS